MGVHPVTKAVLVLGPESSGTRLVTRMLIAMGCAGDGGHKQGFDTEIPVAGSQSLVWRRSLPHANRMPDVDAMCGQVRDLGYEPSIVFTTREWYAMGRSQVRNGHAPTLERALGRSRGAYRLMGACCALAPFVYVPYESLILHPRITMETVNAVLGLGLPAEKAPLEAVIDNNEKHYGKAFQQQWTE
jgi:hypothetical protein